MEITPVTAADLPALEEIEAKGFSEAEPSASGQLKARVKNLGASFLVARNFKREAIGFICKGRL